LTGFPVALFQGPAEIISDIMPRAEPPSNLSILIHSQRNPQFTKRKCNNDPLQLKLKSNGEKSNDFPFSFWYSGSIAKKQ
jgi:hypothetical protein